MRAIHGFWSWQRGLCLWAEDAGLAVKSPSQAVRSARPHPFAVPAQKLAEIHPGKPDIGTLLLPSLRTAPLDSPELVRRTPRPGANRQPALASWSVPVVHFDAIAALTVLDRPEGLDGPAEDVRYGASVGYVSAVAAFARELVERGRVLPAVENDTFDSEGDGYAARWRPVLQGPDVVAFQELVAAIPPIFRCEARTPDNTQGSNPTDLVSDALHALVDAAVRERLAATGTSVLAAVPRRGRRPKRLPVAEAWLQALGTTDGRFDGETTDAGELQRALQPWSEVGLGQTGPARATFRLSEVPAPGTLLDVQPHDGEPAEGEPAEGEPAEQDWITDQPDAAVAGSPTWRLEFLLQSVEDPSLLVPADQIWAGGDGLHRWMGRPDELMLSELGRASSIYPELATALRQARPDALELDADGAYDFLANRADLLDQAGFGVLLPSWWSKRRKLGLTASATPTPEGGVTEGMLTREALCQFEWRLAIDDEPLTEDELAALAAAKTPLVRMRGEWVAVDPEQVKRGLEFLKRQGEGSHETTAADVIRLAASHPDDLDTPLPVTAVHADGLLGELLSGAAEQSLAPVEPPADFRANLRGYQSRGLSWLTFLARLGLGACLADDMGLGKTIQLLALEQLHRNESPDAGPTLLVCPMSLVGNWQREAATFAPSMVLYAHHGSARLHGEELDACISGVDIVITTYQTAAKDIDELASRTWERVVLDEAQAIKNELSQSAKAVRRLDARHRVALTGTPMENRLTELWSVMDFLNSGMLGSSELFRARYARPIERYGQTEPTQRLQKVTRPYILRRLKSDKTIIDDLPDKMEIKQYCHLTTEQASLYQSVVDDMVPKIEESDGIERRGNVLSALAKLKQVCNHPAQFLHDSSAVGRRSGKLIRLEEILDEVIAEGDKVLLFTQFTEFADMLLPHLSARFGHNVGYLHGKTPKKRRDELVLDFQSDSGPPIFLLSLKAGGTGLNLTAASHVVHLDRWWNPAVEDQATDRAFRIGQKRNVQVRKFICAGTLEEKIDQMIEQKKALADLVVGDGEGWLTELSTQELRSLFALSKEAVGE